MIINDIMIWALMKYEKILFFNRIFYFLKGNQKVFNNNIVGGDKN